MVGRIEIPFFTNHPWLICWMYTPTQDACIVEFGGFFYDNLALKNGKCFTCPANAGNNGTSTSPGNNGTTGRMSREGSDRIKGYPP